MSSELRDRVVVQSVGRITIPENIRNQLAIKKGSVLEIQIHGKDKILITILIR